MRDKFKRTGKIWGMGEIRVKREKRDEGVEKGVRGFFRSLAPKIRTLSRWKKAGLGMAVIAIIFAGAMVFNVFNVKALSYNWMQTNWSGGADIVSVLTHTVEQANPGAWTKFYSKDSNVDVTTSPGDAKLTQATGTALQTSDTGTGDTPPAGGFNAWTKTNAYVSGSGAGASLVLLKPAGATCAVSAECASFQCLISVCLAGADPCGGTRQITDTRDTNNSTYNTVAVGTQCWLARNMNVGTMLASGSTMPSDPFDWSNAQKWCYSNDVNLCNSEGGFYTWAEAMGLAASCLTTDCSGQITFPRQGICPTGWHIPQDSEQNTLDQYLKTGTCDAARVNAWDCDPAGTKLKTGGTSGMNIPLAGYRYTDGSFYGRTTYAYLWSSSQYSATYAWYRYLNSSGASVHRYYFDKAYGFSVRCLKN